MAQYNWLGIPAQRATTLDPSRLWGLFDVGLAQTDVYSEIAFHACDSGVLGN